MPQRRLTESEVDFIIKMKEVKYNNCEIARSLGVTEGAIRYRIKRRQSGKEDGRKNRSSALDRYSAVIKLWIEDYKESRHRPTIKMLYNTLVGHHGYDHSYDAVRRYIRKHYPQFWKKGIRIRVETPPGELMQIDWKEDIRVQMGEFGHWVKLHGLCFSLGFSRKMVVGFSEKKDINSFISLHQDAFRKYGGLPDVMRPDCLKSAIVKWRGSDSVLNKSYEKYLDKIGIKVFPSRPGTPTDKGKMEKKIRDLFSSIDFKHRLFKDMADLHRQVDAKIMELERQWRCGATGLSVAQSFEYEKKYLRKLPQNFPIFHNLKVW